MQLKGIDPHRVKQTTYNLNPSAVTKVCQRNVILIEQYMVDCFPFLPHQIYV